MRKMILKIISVLLCFAVITSGTIACATNCSVPDSVDDTVKIKIVFAFFRESPSFFSNIKSVVWYGSKVKILDYNGLYTYVENPNTKEKGYIFSMFLDDDEDGSLSTDNSAYSVYEGVKKFRLSKLIMKEIKM